MRIGITSDTHGSIGGWQKFLNGVGEVDLIIHGGDLLYHGPRNPLPADYNPSGLAKLINLAPATVVAARGNCDAEVDQLLISWPIQAPYAFIQAEGLRFLVTHGHLATPDELLAQAVRYRANVVVTGHTHLPVMKKSEDVLLINPGSPALPKDDQKRPTAVLLAGREASLIDLNQGTYLQRINL